MLICRMFHFVWLVLLMPAISFADEACQPLVGTYEYYGKILNSKELSDYPARLSHYFGFDVAHLFKPKRVIVVADSARQDVVFVDIIAHGILNSGTYPLPKVVLPRRVQLVCQSGRWFREARSQGGVDGAYHENEQRVFFERQHNGDILVDSYSKTVSGFFFKDTSEYHFVVRFREIHSTE
jgi:hypothetical protein